MPAVQFEQQIAIYFPDGTSVYVRTERLGSVADGERFIIEGEDQTYRVKRVQRQLRRTAEPGLCEFIMTHIVLVLWYDEQPPITPDAPPVK